MLHSKLSRHAFAFGLIVVASLTLYPAAKGEKTLIVYLLLALIIFAALLTLFKEK